jgi:hypothetical protein
MSKYKFGAGYRHSVFLKRSKVAFVRGKTNNYELCTIALRQNDSANRSTTTV